MAEKYTYYVLRLYQENSQQVCTQVNLYLSTDKIQWSPHTSAGLECDPIEWFRRGARVTTRTVAAEVAPAALSPYSYAP